MQSTSVESRVILAIETLKNETELSLWATAKIYNIPEATLRHRLKGRRARQDVCTNSLKLTELEENTLLQYILDLNTRGFPPRLVDFEDMTNNLLADHGASCVGSAGLQTLSNGNHNFGGGSIVHMII